jgi:retron-type reverse transcriptase
MLAELCSDDNLQRAWRWIRSNPDASYKRYFRDLYAIYAIADDRLLKRLQDLIRRNIYEPTRAGKLFFPKPSGIVRPYSLLTVDDQIAYQAAVNLVAGRLLPKVKHRHQTEVFGHLYAGRSSTWFYRKWRDGYKAFNDASRKAFADGFRVAASFDLTACYDSLDHGVLRHMLQDIGCDKDFAALLTKWLSVWTATDHGVYHNHGIPQGPLSSGLLSEVVLRHFDDHRRHEVKVRYLRYVDDIRLFAKSERELRRMLVRLDLLSKDIGLFPQASKISIHEVKDIEAELKTISHPTESSIRGRIVNQPRLKKRLVALTPRFRVQDATRFKYLLAHARPDAKLTSRLWRIFDRHPEFYAQFARYLERYRRLPRRTAERLIKEIERQQLYPAVRAEFLCAAHGRLSDKHARTLATLVKGELWRPKTMPADLFAVSGRLLLNAGRLTVNQLRYACQGVKHWWGRAQLVLALDPSNVSGTTLSELLNAALRDRYDAVALAAAFGMAMKAVALQPPRNTIRPAAAEVLKELGIIARTPPPPCGIEDSLKRMLGTVPPINWKAVFGANYRDVEKHTIYTRALAETNVSAWANAVDVFNDWLLVALYAHDPSLGTYTFGSIGSNMQSKRLKKDYPAIQAVVVDFHTKRLESPLSHAKTKSTGKPTKPIRWGYLKVGKRLLRKALAELAAKW